MFNGLAKLLRFMLGESLARLFIGGGISLVSFVTLLPIVQGALAAAMSQMQGIGAVTAALVYKSGIGVALTTIGTAMIIRTTINAGKLSIGKK